MDDDDDIDPEEDDYYAHPSVPDPTNPYAPEDEDADGLPDDEEDDY